MALYVPTYNNNNCVVLSNQEVVRVYSSRPTTNSTISYTDYYIRSHYISNSGVASFSQYTTIPTCRTDITTNWYYRQDLTDILMCFMLITLFIYFLGFRPIQRLLGRWLKW